MDAPLTRADQGCKPGPLRGRGKPICETNAARRLRHFPDIAQNMWRESPGRSGAEWMPDTPHELLLPPS
jgi:hypothetical protein